MAVDKLVDSTQLNADLTSVANAIRAKGGTSASLAFPGGFVDAIGDIETGGGGGASNVVTGTFTGTTTGAAMDVPLDYSGSGYPIAVMVYVSSSDTSTFNSLIQRYAIRDYIADKLSRNEVPTYDSQGTINYAICTSKYKNSTSNGYTYSDSGSTNANTLLYSNTGATASSGLAVRMKSNNLMSVFIASDSYGFAANIEYTYYVIYSE